VTLRWMIATDAAAVHELIEASDRKAAESTGTKPPIRHLESSDRLVRKGFVHIGIQGHRLSVTVTIGPEPSFAVDQDVLPTAASPWYMQRLAISPDSRDSLIGVQAVRHVISFAATHGADALRAEANPDLSRVLRMLTMLGFTRHATDLSGPLPRTYMHLMLPSSDPGVSP
jgi:ribosomal protein S18 acetylase RimI-like enzyme